MGNTSGQLSCFSGLEFLEVEMIKESVLGGGLLVDEGDELKCTNDLHCS